MSELTLKGIKSFIGREGHGFNATLYLDGKKVAFVIDEANGGCYRYDWMGKDWDERKKNQDSVEAVIKGLAAEKVSETAEEWEKSLYPNGFREWDMDSYIGKLVDDAESAKMFAKKMKTHVLFNLSNDKPGNFWQMKHNGDIPNTKAVILKKHPDAVFIEPPQQEKKVVKKPKSP